MPDGQGSMMARAPDGAPLDEATSTLRQVTIERALIDVSLLRTFVSGGSETRLERAFTDSAFPAKPPAETKTKDEFLRRLAEIEEMGAAALPRDPAAVAFLFAARDTLNAVAAPADAYTIAFTGLYTGGLPEAEVLRQRGDFAEMRAQARTSKFVISGLAVGGVLAVMLAVWLSVHALVGKTVLDQIGQTRIALVAIDKEIAEADTATLATIDPKPTLWLAVLPRMCERMAILGSAPARFNEPWVYGYEGPNHWLLCDRRSAANDRYLVAQSELARWIDTTTGPRMGWLPGLSIESPEMHINYTSEQVGRALLNALGVYYLPVLFGLLGGAVYAVRRLNQKIVSSELHPRDWRHALFRIFMAFLIGGCIGLFFSPEGTKFDGPNGEVTLSIAALAFLAGYSVEVVFRFFDMVITQALRVVSAIAPSAGGGGSRSGSA